MAIATCNHCVPRPAGSLSTDEMESAEANKRTKNLRDPLVVEILHDINVATCTLTLVVASPHKNAARNELASSSSFLRVKSAIVVARIMGSVTSPHVRV